MITKFKSIQSLAVFRNFLWDTHVVLPDSKVDKFKQINILYGRNYSGKTTLSRIIRALETGTISPHYISPQFSVLWNDKPESTATDLQGHEKTIRVFNEDFVRENLGFLTNSTNSQGQIKSFAVIGADNVKIETAIKAIETKLGSAEEGKETGLYATLKAREDALTSAIQNYQNAKNALQQKKNDKATDRQNGIKYRSNIFGDQNYTIAKLDSDIQSVLSNEYTPIDDIKRQELGCDLKEVPKTEISLLKPISLEFQPHCDKVKTTVERKIGSSEKIQELVREYALNEWVKKGRELHKGKRTACVFCGGEISPTRWDILERHFDEETERLEKELTQLIEKIHAHQTAVTEGFDVSKESFYTKFHSEIEGLLSEYKTAATRYCEQLDTLTQQLEKRKQAITVDFIFVAPTDTSADIEAVFTKYEGIRTQSNAHTVTLAIAKKEAQKTLRLHEVRTFVDDIGYVPETERITSLETAKQTAKTSTQAVQSEIRDKLQSIEDLKRQLNDEEKGAVKVSKYLNHFFGHQFLTLKALTDKSTGTKQIRFEIMRGEQKAFNLSEGECSLIAFCYFMAKLEDISTSGKQPIIWIDDPISSLDGNHIFFVYSLLLAEIVDKNQFEQLFVSTHNLEFLKYLKRLKGKDEQNRDYQKAWFIVERTNDNAVIKVMPKYLKEYITEFNYLFQQIYKCAQATTTDDSNYAMFYNFGNNARKFLDIYLYYKYPDGITETDSHKDKISRLFGDKISSFLTDRVDNEHSHLSGTFERGAMPVDVPEMQTVAKQICQKIKEADTEQYKALLNSVGERNGGEIAKTIKNV